MKTTISPYPGIDINLALYIHPENSVVYACPLKLRDSYPDHFDSISSASIYLSKTHPTVPRMVSSAGTVFLYGGILNKGVRKSKVKSVIDKANSYLSKQCEACNFTELGITYNFNLKNVDSDEFKYNKKKYVTILIDYGNPFDGAYVNFGGFVSIEVGKRPSLNHIKSKMLHYLRNPFPGQYEIIEGRYLFRFQLLSQNLIDTLLNTAKKGDGTTIDYSWIGPLQEIQLKQQSLRNKLPIGAKKIVKKVSIAPLNRRKPVWNDSSSDDFDFGSPQTLPPPSAWPEEIQLKNKQKVNSAIKTYLETINDLYGTNNDLYGAKTKVEATYNNAGIYFTTGGDPTFKK